jgi:CRISPR type III-B/RAMP module RAMP protein Cmr1
MWRGDIDVELKIRSLRIGKGIPTESVDLPVSPINYSGSSIKGVLRKAARRVSHSAYPDLKDLEKDVFGDENREGKIHITTKKSSSEKNVRFGIKIDPKFGSVESGHLFSYEYLAVDSLRFSIRPVFPLNKKEALLIYCALNFLRFESLGGFGSRGLGLIEDVCISEKFVEYVRRGGN